MGNFIVDINRIKEATYVHMYVGCISNTYQYVNAISLGSKVIASIRTVQLISRLMIVSREVKKKQAVHDKQVSNLQVAPV